MVSNPDNFEFLYQGCFSPIYKFFYFRVRNRDVALDLTQDVFTKAYASGMLIDPETALRYFYTIARNRLTDHFRKKHAVDVGSFEDLAVRTDDPLTPDPETALASQDLVDQVHQLLRHLSESDREIVAMKYLQELGNAEVAALTGKTQEGVRQVLSRSLRKLKLFYESSHTDN